MTYVRKIEQYKDGKLAVYSGQFGSKFKYNGWGNLTYENGENLEGRFDDGKFQEGRALYINKDGNWFDGVGNFEKKTGSGKITYRNGHFYEGSWVDEKREGYGTYTNGYTKEVMKGKYAKDLEQGDFQVYAIKNGR